jgi:hypothetical protein
MAPVSQLMAPVSSTLKNHASCNEGKIMLDNKVIIYDDSCPMCKLYTYWFVAWGFLKPENRIGFASAPADVTSHVDLVRGRHEIPLYDRSTNETIYGLSALTFILGSRWKWMNPVFESKPFYWFFHPIYEIITYNRRVIAGCKACCGFDCAPDLNRFYRSVYLGLASFTIATIMVLLFVLGAFAGKIAIGITLAMLIVGLICGSLTRVTNDSLAGWNYAGNFITTVLIMALVMTPIALIASLPAELAWLNMAAATLLGLSELRRREL